ncbi:hypothetical protein DIPPA_27488 [Diplonema papillatum]|nr:hypothetical protein DIPPA_27488 [Diplonema papillatum]
MGAACSRSEGRACELTDGEAGVLVANQWLVCGWERYLAGDMEAAEGYFRRVLRINPGHALANVNLARVHAGRGAVHKAKRRLAKVLRSEPKQQQALDLLAHVSASPGGGVSPPPAARAELLRLSSPVPATGQATSPPRAVPQAFATAPATGSPQGQQARYTPPRRRLRVPLRFLRCPVR